MASTFTKSGRAGRSPRRQKEGGGARAYVALNVRLHVEGAVPQDIPRPNPERLLLLAGARFARYVWRGHLAAPVAHRCPGCLYRIIRQAGFSGQYKHLISVWQESLSLREFTILVKAHVRL